jgi:hypothetical protein
MVGLEIVNCTNSETRVPGSVDALARNFPATTMSPMLVYSGNRMPVMTPRNERITHCAEGSLDLTAPNVPHRLRLRRPRR